MVLLDRDAILRGLSKLDARARAAGVVVDLAVYGGAALILAFDTRRSTRDVDAVVRGAPDFVRQAAARIAAEEGWPADWLNDGVKGFTSARENLRLMARFQASPGGGLRVYTPAPEYLFAMKCMAMRPEGWEGSHDISDIETLAEAIGIRDAETALALVEDFYPAARVPAKVRFGVEEIMERVAARRELEGAERERRLAALAASNQAGGVAAVFGRHAGAAIRAAGPAGEVDWAAIEREATLESLNAGRTPHEIAEALCRHSPGAVSPARQAALRAEVDRHAARLRPADAVRATAKPDPGFGPTS